jgi:hypothetical protein
MSTLARLRKVLEAAPTEHAGKAASAEVLLVVTDSTIPGAGRESLVTLVELATQKPLMHMRKQVDPALSKGSGAHREQVDACALALAVRREVGPLG